MATPTKKKSEGLQIQTVTRGTFTACVLGTSPFICNAMSAKAWHEFIMPSRENKRKSSSLKHDVVQEFRDSMYTDHTGKRPTIVQALAAMFKAAMVGCTVDMPDASKAGIGRNVWVRGERVDMYGTPQMMMAIVRSAGMNRTPDVRTRACLPEWCCEVTVDFATPMLTAQKVAQLLATAGIVMGVGDWRPEKGSGNYGQFQLVDKSNKDFQRIKKLARKAQMDAIDHPSAYDDETQKMLTWFEDEKKARGI